MGCVFDSFAEHMRDQDPLRTFLPLEKESTREQIIEELRDSAAEMLVNYLPVGSEQATRFYASCALEAGLGFVNNIPVFIASDPVWAKRLPIKTYLSSATTSRPKSAPLYSSHHCRSVPQAWCQGGTDLSAEHRRQHRFLEHV